MKIKEFAITRYGPLPGTPRVPLGSFCLLFGKNEYGKTLTIDALVKLLLRQNKIEPLFEAIKRVGEDPNGYVIIEDDAGNEIKLPEKGSLTTLTELKVEECRNIFIIRNSNLSINREGEFYRSVTDRLTGLRTDDIQKIKSQLQETGKLTRADAGASLRDVAGEKLKTKTDRAAGLFTHIEELEEKAVVEELDKLEELIFFKRRRLAELIQQIDTMEAARQRERYEQGSQSLALINYSTGELNTLSVYTDDDTGLWADCERDIKSGEESLVRLQNMADDKKREMEQKTKELNENNIAFEILRHSKKEIDEAVRPEIRICETKSAELKDSAAKSKFYTFTLLISVLLLAVSVAGTAWNPSPMFYGLLGLFFIATLTLTLLKLSPVKKRGLLAKRLESARLNAARFGLRGDTIEELLYALNSFDDIFSSKQRELDETDREVSLLSREIGKLTQDDLTYINRNISEAGQKIEAIARRISCLTLADYREKLKLKEKHINEINTQRMLLDSLFSTKGNGLETNLRFWAEEIEALRDYADKATGITSDDRVTLHLKEERRTLIQEIDNLDNKLEGFHAELKKIEAEANGILNPEEGYLNCDTSMDMAIIKDKLENYISQINENMDNARIAIGIFQDMAREEEAKIGALFGKDSPVTTWFREITGGIYEQVEFMADDSKKIKVTLRNGTVLDAENLSGGAYDQLYLAIRLALGEKLLKDDKGFFIMDDPFIKADTERLTRQMGILKRISDSGWQIIYFTAKDEVKEALKYDIETGSVNYIELQGIYA